MTSIKNHYFLAFYIFTVQHYYNTEMLQPIWYWAEYYKAEILATTENYVDGSTKQIIFINYKRKNHSHQQQAGIQECMQAERKQASRKQARSKQKASSNQQVQFHLVIILALSCLLCILCANIENSFIHLFHRSKPII